MQGELKGIEGDMTRTSSKNDETLKDVKGKSRGKPVVRKQFRGHEGAVHGNGGNSGGT